MKLEVGQQLWFAPASRHGYSSPRFVTVEKTGRKWATLARNIGRVDMETLTVDGGGYSSPGRCYLTREEWDECRRQEVCWARLQVFMRNQWNRPQTLTREQITEAAQILGGDALVAEMATALEALEIK